MQSQKTQHAPIASNNNGNQEKMLSVSGKKKCSHCGEELGNRTDSGSVCVFLLSTKTEYHTQSSHRSGCSDDN